MFRFAAKNLLSRPVRSLLALCGLSVAIAGMVGLFSVAEGIEDSVARTFGKVPGLTVMQPGAPIPLFSRIPTAWGEELRAIDGVHVVHPEVWSRAHVIDGKPTLSPPRFLFGSDLVEAQKLGYSVYREGLKEGRELTPDDRGQPHILISRAIADEFHKRLHDPLRVDGRDFEIVGIYEAQSLLLDVAIILDIDEVRSLARVGADSVSNFYVEPNPGVDRKELASRIKALFRGRAPDTWQPSLATASELTGGKPVEPTLGGLLHALGDALQKPPAGDTASKEASARPATGKGDTNGKSEGTAANGSPGQGHPLPANEQNAAETKKAPDSKNGASRSASDELPVEVRGSDDWADEFQRFSADLDVFLMLMTGIGVTIAFVGIVNTMLMSVTERFIEFGILKANGWSDGQVLRLIAFESGLLGVTGGVVGSFLGWLATLAVNARWPTRIHLFASPELLLFSLAFSTLLGVAAGLYPAFRAARMMPMDAIRRG